MANLKEIRSRIVTVKNTQQVTKAMKMVSAAKLRRAQDQMHKLRPYALKLKEIIANVVAAVNVEDIPSDLVKERPLKNVLLVVVTSNRGLCGGFNANLLRTVSQFIDDHLAEYKQGGNIHAICIGKKGYEYLIKKGVKMVDNMMFDALTKISFEAANEVTERIFAGFRKGEWDKVYLGFNEFKNVMVQERVVEQFLPIAIQPVESQNTNSDYIFEPNREEILIDLIPKSLRVRIFRAILESNAAEQGARMVAMEQATENGEALLKDLKLRYNKARQAAITKEILEIAGGADALANM